MLSEVPETNKLLDLDLVMQALVCLRRRSGQGHRRSERGELVRVDFPTVDGANGGLCIKLLPILKCWQCYMYGRCNQMDRCVDGKKTVASGVSRSMCESATMRKFRDGPMRGSS